MIFGEESVLVTTRSGLMGVVGRKDVGCPFGRLMFAISKDGILTSDTVQGNCLTAVETPEEVNKARAAAAKNIEATEKSLAYYKERITYLKSRAASLRPVSMSKKTSEQQAFYWGEMAKQHQQRLFYLIDSDRVTGPRIDRLVALRKMAEAKESEWKWERDGDVIFVRGFHGGCVLGLYHRTQEKSWIDDPATEGGHWTGGHGPSIIVRTRADVVVVRRLVEASILEIQSMILDHKKSIQRVRIGLDTLEYMLPAA